MAEQAPSCDRTCGTCTLCCKIMPVLELEKHAMTWCKHCDIGKGCKIYDNPPQSCRTFNCLWLTNGWMPDSLRPDRCGIVYEGLHGTNVCLALLNEGHDEAHEREPNVSLIKHLVAVAGQTVIVFRAYKSREPIIYMPPGMTREELVRQVEWGSEQNLKRFAEQEGISLEDARARDEAFKAAREMVIGP